MNRRSRSGKLDPARGGENGERADDEHHHEHEREAAAALVPEGVELELGREEHEEQADAERRELLLEMPQRARVVGHAVLEGEAHRHGGHQSRLALRRLGERKDEPDDRERDKPDEVARHVPSPREPREQPRHRPRR